MLYLEDGQVHVNGPAEDLSDQILEVYGATEEVDRLLSRLGGVRELRREEITTGRRSIIDMRDRPELVDAAYDLAHQLGGRLKVRGITLEQAVLAMSGERR